MRHEAFIKDTIGYAEMLRLFVFNSPVAMALVDLDMNYIAHSYAWLEMWQCGHIERGVNHYDLFPDLKAERPNYISEHKKAMSEGIQIHNTSFYQGKKFAYTLVPVFSEGQPLQSQSGDVVGLIMRVDVIYEQ